MLGSRLIILLNFSDSWSKRLAAAPAKTVPTTALSIAIFNPFPLSGHYPPILFFLFILILSMSLPDS